MPNSYLPRTTDRRPGRDSDNGDESGEPGREAAATGVGSGDVGRERDADAGGDGDGRSRDGSGVVAEAGSPAAETARSSPPRRLADDDSHAIIHIPVSVGRLVNMSVFILPAGTAIPLHDHPGMTVVTKVLWGTLHVKSYDLVRPRGSAGRLLLPGGGGARALPAVPPLAGGLPRRGRSRSATALRPPPPPCPCPPPGGRPTGRCRCRRAWRSRTPPRRWSAATSARLAPPLAATCTTFGRRRRGGARCSTCPSRRTTFRAVAACTTTRPPRRSTRAPPRRWPRQGWCRPPG